MRTTTAGWRKLFLFSFGLALGASLCMKWMEPDFWQGGERFTILGLEWFYSKEKTQGILAGLTPGVHMALKYHLYFDFAFMAGIYPAIASLCMIAAEKFRGGIRRLLFVAAAVQLLAWLGDILENNYLLGWLQTPQVGNDWETYHAVVAAKWLLAVLGVLTGLVCWLAGRRKSKALQENYFFI